MGNAWGLYAHPELTPSPLKESEFPPDLGFTQARKPRVMIATKEQLESAKIALEDRDYCAHLLLEYRGCRTRVWPFAYKCHHEKHNYLNCEYDDYVLRMKEFERERRLLQRQAQAAQG
ncbi:NADH dehydrogenase [ubiquinone] 1 beta subcomplex subunit 7 [Chrysoperla carnea]|uniref:NADH dehydrogenase [ubiquinone] 1 beta subcomplex subunit 7 n=1 Tax=Chrysoperla carnea TaxID=189513 RepID=UPI001D066DC8|nr:NADH dehydrogenase [ubiquinone] 1 beta subcomplex subunit 7 [Chrysoperla carnea]